MRTALFALVLFLFASPALAEETPLLEASAFVGVVPLGAPDSHELEPGRQVGGALVFPFRQVHALGVTGNVTLFPWRDVYRGVPSHGTVTQGFFGADYRHLLDREASLFVPYYDAAIGAAFFRGVQPAGGSVNPIGFGASFGLGLDVRASRWLRLGFSAHASITAPGSIGSDDIDTGDAPDKGPLPPILSLAVRTGATFTGP